MDRKNLFMLICVIVIVGFSAVGGFIVGKNSNAPKKVITVMPNPDIISIKIANTQHMSTGTVYTIIMKNTSGLLIKQNSVYISYPIKLTNSNKCKVEATGNKLDIKPGDAVTLNVFIPIENYRDNKYIDSNRPQYEVSGYLNEVIPMNHFGQSGGLSN